MTGSRLWTVVAVVLLATLAGCSSPSVTTEFLAEEVNSLTAWQLELKENSEQPDSSVDLQHAVPEMFGQSKTTDSMYAREYVESVRKVLSNTYDIHDYENVPDRGRIVIELIGSRYLMLADYWRDGAKNTKNIKTFPAESSVEFKDAVAEVKLYFQDPLGQVIGEISIAAANVSSRFGTDELKEIKPEFVAKVIAQSIAKNRIRSFWHGPVPNVKSNSGTQIRNTPVTL